MAADDGAAAVVLPQSHQLREEPGRKEAGVPTHAAVAQGRDPLWVCPPEGRQPGHALPPQQRLVADGEQHPVAVPELCQPQLDGAADPIVRVGLWTAAK